MQQGRSLSLCLRMHRRFCSLRCCSLRFCGQTAWEHGVSPKPRRVGWFLQAGLMARLKAKGLAATMLPAWGWCRIFGFCVRTWERLGAEKPGCRIGGLMVGCISEDGHPKHPEQERKPGLFHRRRERHGTQRYRAQGRDTTARCREGNEWQIPCMQTGCNHCIQSLAACPVVQRMIPEQTGFWIVPTPRWGRPAWCGYGCDGSRDGLWTEHGAVRCEL